jgi:hypothetical protein
MRKSLRELSVEITACIVAVSYPTWIQEGAYNWRSCAAEESSPIEGLDLRTPNHYGWILVPPTIAGYEAIKRELGGIGIPLAKTFISFELGGVRWPIPANRHRRVRFHGSKS